MPFKRRGNIVPEADIIRWANGTTNIPISENTEMAFYAGSQKGV